jgi:hypothetical protein
MTTPLPFRFDEQLHAYYDEREMLLPSVTQVLKANGFINFDGVPQAVLERKRRLGSLVHRVTELYDNGEDLSTFDIPPAVWEYAEGWINFCNDSGFQPEHSELRMLGETFGMVYGMTLDVIGKLKGELYIIEKKCGANASPVWGLQTAAYDLGRHGKPTAKRAVVQLGPQFARGYTIPLPYAEPTDYQIWTGALAQTIWKMNKGIFKLEAIPEREAA